MSERGAIGLGEESGTWGCFESSGRAVPEEPDGIRTDFQRDRDRIIHSKSFRRLMHKTQVFISPDGDHFRTRLTHTLEVMQISRTIARALDLNEDLTEAVALGHDLGHTPFGHTGETALNSIVSEYGREFRHNHHSLRVVEHLERDGRGLNLTTEVRDGILNHTGDGMPSTREGEIVRTADRIAYVNHDVDDALRAGIISLESLPENSLAALGLTTKTRIDTLVRDMISTSRDAGGIALSAEIYDALMELRSWLFTNVYQRPLTRQNEKAAGVVRSLFAHYYRIHELEREDPVRSTTDFVAGMTDRFAIAAYRDIFLPKGDIFA